MLTGLGWLFIAVGACGAAGGLWLLSDADATIEFNGIRTADTVPKLLLVGVFAVVGVMGGFIVRGGVDTRIRRLDQDRVE